MTATSASPTSLQRQHSTDIDEHAQRIVGWRQAYSQLTPGRFDGTLLQGSIGRTMLVGERTNQRLRECFTVPAGTLVVAVPVAPSGPAHWGGARLDASTVAVCRGGAPTELLTPQEFGIVGVALPVAGSACASLVPGELRVVHDAALAGEVRALFEGAVGALLAGPAGGARAADASVEGAGRRADDCGDAYGDTHAGRLADGQDGTCACTYADPFAAAFADEVAAIVERVADAPGGRSRDPSLARRLALVRRAEAFVAEHAEAAPTVADLCRATGACRRTLQASFVDVLGIGPSRYLRALRLNRARTDLRRGAASVSEVAVRWGFWHLGRFAADYRAMFGEPPSRTRARVRGDADIG